MDKKNKNLGVPPAEADGGPPSGLGRSASLPDRPSRLRRGSAGNALLRTAPVRPNAAAGDISVHILQWRHRTNVVDKLKEIFLYYSIVDCVEF